MKKLFISLFALMVASASFAQEDLKRNEFKTTYGKCFFGYGDITGTLMIAEYSYLLTPKYSIAAAVSNANASSFRNPVNQASAQSLELAFYYTPFNSWFGSLKVGGGLAGRYLNYNYESGRRMAYEIPDPSSNIVYSHEFTSVKGFSEGWTTAAEYNFPAIKNFTIGARASLQNYRTHSTVYYLGLVGGVKF
jgi:hypothetical protein